MGAQPTMATSAREAPGSAGEARGADKWGGCVLRAGSVLLPYVSLNRKEAESSKCEPNLKYIIHACVCQGGRVEHLLSNSF